MKLSIGKLSRILTKERKSLVDSGYFKDPYNDRAYLGYLIVKTEDSSKWQGKWLVFDLRGFRYNPKRYKLEVSAVNWNLGGTLSIELNTNRIKHYSYTKTSPVGDEFLV